MHRALTIVLLGMLAAGTFTPALAANRKLTWDANSEPTLAGYKVYFGTTSRGCIFDPVDERFVYSGGAAAQGASPIVVFLNELANPASPSYVLVNVPENVAFFSVTAIDAAGLESRYSDEAQLGAQGPVVCDASANTSTTLVVSYNEFVEQATASTPANYDLRDAANNPINITGVIYDSTTFKHVTLMTEPLTEGVSYILTINGVEDYFDGNPIAPDSTFNFKFTEAPRILSVNPLNHPPPQVEVQFSEDVSTATATIAGNYAINPGVFVNVAQKAIDLNQSDNNRDVHLTTSALAEGTAYTLTVDDVADEFGHVIAPNSMHALTLPVDATAPRALSAHVTSPLLKRNEVHVVFDEEIDADSADNTGSYVINKGITVSSATPLGDHKTVVLATSSHPDGDYQITVSGVKDNSAAGNVMTQTVLHYRVVDAITDSDGDGRENVRDNCTNVANVDQVDTDGDFYGNACDADFDNNNLVNTSDLVYFRSVFFTADAEADLNSDGIINAVDLAILRSRFFQPPGPSGTAP